jgi:hypothetical protein
MSAWKGSIIDPGIGSFCLKARRRDRKRSAARRGKTGGGGELSAAKSDGLQRGWKKRPPNSAGKALADGRKKKSARRRGIALKSRLKTSADASRSSEIR